MTTHKKDDGGPALSDVLRTANTLLAVLGAWCKSKRGYGDLPHGVITVEMVEDCCQDLQDALMLIPGYSNKGTNLAAMLAERTKG